MEKHLIINQRQCTNCNEIIISHHVHDYVTCSCGKAMVDGGNSYQRYSIDNEYPSKDLSIYSDASYEEIREVLYRGGRGKNGTEELKYVPLNEMSNNWVEKCISYEKLLRPDNKYLKYYRQEVEYRKKNKILIKD